MGEGDFAELTGPESAGAQQLRFAATTLGQVARSVGDWTEAADLGARMRDSENMRRNTMDAQHAVSF